MGLTITLDELLAWTAEERAKWLPWLKANPAALDVVVQPGGRFPTVASLIDHVLLVEHRHILRLQRKELPTTTGVDPKDIDALWAYGERTRRGVLLYAALLSAADADQPRDIAFGAVTLTTSPRKLLFHLVLHEVRHWAQVASVLRAAGFAPPGEHDLLFSKALV